MYKLGFNITRSHECKFACENYNDEIDEWWYYNEIYFNCINWNTKTTANKSGNTEFLITNSCKFCSSFFSDLYTIITKCTNVTHDPMSLSLL